MPDSSFEQDAIVNYLIEFLGRSLYDAESLTFEQLAELLDRHLLTGRLGSPPTDLQHAIWRVLRGHAMKSDQLAGLLCDGDTKRLYGRKN